MTTHLFDTNAWLRASQEPEKLSPAATRAIFESGRDPIALSAISVWEVSLKLRKGRLTLFAPLDQWLAITLRPAFVHVLPIDADIARGANELPGDFHGDPADRFIVATARKHNLTIITSDGLIRRYSGVPTLW